MLGPMLEIRPHHGLDRCLPALDPLRQSFHCVLREYSADDQSMEEVAMDVSDGIREAIQMLEWYIMEAKEPICCLFTGSHVRPFCLGSCEKSTKIIMPPIDFACIGSSQFFMMKSATHVGLVSEIHVGCGTHAYIQEPHH